MTKASIVTMLLLLAMMEIPNMKLKDAILKKWRQNMFKNYVNLIEYVLIELPKFDLRDIRNIGDEKGLWLCYFKAANNSTMDEIEVIKTKSEAIAKAIEKLEKLKWEPQELLEYERCEDAEFVRKGCYKKTPFVKKM